MTKTIAWVLNRLDAVGGGERLLLEGAKYYRSIGYRVLIFTWAFDVKALFDGLYENIDIIVLRSKETDRRNILQRALSRGRTLQTLRKALIEHKVSKVFVQGEYDAALVYLATLGTDIPYRFLIFGQIFQYPHDSAKYAMVFRKHLETIVASRPGYRDTVPLVAPPLSVVNRLASEIICWVRLRAVRKAERRFSFSRQIQWETELLFGCTTEIAGGAFPASLLASHDFGTEALATYGLKSGQYILSLSRLDRKKRVDLIIAAFAAMQTDKILVIAGGGADADFLLACARDSGAQDRIRFVGLVSEPYMLPLKYHAALFVSMDIGDYDISPLEALAVGTPALCPTDFDAVPELLAVQGFSRTEPTVNEITSAMIRALDTSGDVAREGLRPWSWEAYFTTLIKT